MITSEHINECCRASYEKAYEATINPGSSYIYANGIDDYSSGLQGLDVLDLMSNMKPTVGRCTVLDVGAGDGVFLRDVLGTDPRGIRGVAFSTVRHPEQVQFEADWIFGDFQRPGTWKPAGVLTQGSVDVSFSNRTYRHFVHPLGAMMTNAALLRADGSMFIDCISIHLAPNNADDVAKEIEDELEKAKGDHDFYLSYRNAGASLPFLQLEAVHILGSAKHVLAFDRICPTVRKDLIVPVVYDLLQPA
ncbi:MAG: hypothetical protein WAW63_01175 [Candidatus Saccharimonadales bacterium]